jgi:hypothetical protein
LFLAFWNGRAHGDGGFDARIADGNFPAIGLHKYLPRDRERRVSPKGMARHADALQIQPAFQWRICRVQFRNLINRERHIQWTVHRILHIESGFG